jgi:RNA polymerase sigma factor (TIGR02999 family)
VRAEAELSTVYDELRRIAAIHLSRSARQPSLQATQLVHEAWLRLSGREWRSKTHFMALASRAMRMVLIDTIRARHAQKREGGRDRVELGPDAEFASQGLSCPMETIIDVDRALEELVQTDGRKAQVVEMRFFGGLDFPEIAEALDVSLATAKRDWEFSRAWLFNRLAVRPAERPGTP